MEIDAEEELWEYFDAKGIDYDKIDKRRRKMCESMLDSSFEELIRHYKDEYVKEAAFYAEQELKEHPEWHKESDNTKERKQ